MARKIIPNVFRTDEAGLFMLLGTGEKVRLDDADVPKVSELKWTRHRVKCYTYVRATRFDVKTGTERQVLLQRHLKDYPEGLWVDHRDGDTLNNRQSNLRSCLPSDNKRNRSGMRRSRSPYKGIFQERGGWVASVRRRTDSKILKSPSFVTPEEAAHWYDRVAREQQGEFACVNFPTEHERAARAGAP